MLQQAYAPPDEPSPPSSPIRRLVEPAFSSPASNTSVADAEFVTSTPAPSEGHSIKKEAFSPNYFKSFFVEEKELGRGGKGVVLLVRHELDRVSLGIYTHTDPWWCTPLTMLRSVCLQKGAGRGRSCLARER